MIGNGLGKVPHAGEIGPFLVVAIVVVYIAWLSHRAYEGKDLKSRNLLRVFAGAGAACLGVLALLFSPVPLEFTLVFAAVTLAASIVAGFWIGFKGPR